MKSVKVSYFSFHFDIVIRASHYQVHKKGRHNNRSPYTKSQIRACLQCRVMNCRATKALHGITKLSRNKIQLSQFQEASYLTELGCGALLIVPLLQRRNLVTQFVRKVLKNGFLIRLQLFKCVKSNVRFHRRIELSKLFLSIIQKLLAGSFLEKGFN